MRQRIGMVTAVILAAFVLAHAGGVWDLFDTTDPAGAQSPKASVEKGAALFQKKCVFCHFADKTDAKGGPGLKGLFKLDKLPASKRPVTEANIRAQLATPYDEMPAFPDLKGDDLKALMDYLKTL